MGNIQGTKLQLIVRGPRKMRIAEFIWNKISQPRHRFIIWLAVQGRLLTKDRLRRMTISMDNTSCSLCDAQIVETQKHLFSNCVWTRGIITEMSQWSGMLIPTGDVKQVLEKIKRENWKQLKKEITAALWASVVYHVWQARNWKLYRGAKMTIGTTVT